MTQTAFWTAYRAAFSDRVQRLGPQVPALMTASEVIKIVSEIVPGASASVEPNPNDPSGKVFLIKGIQERRGALPIFPLPVSYSTLKGTMGR